MGLFDILNASKIKEENEQLKAKLVSLGYDEYEQVKQEIDRGNLTIADNANAISRQNQQTTELSEQIAKQEKQLKTAINKLTKSKELYKSIDYSIANFFNSEVPFANCTISNKESDELEELVPSVILKLHCMDVKSLRKEFRENDKQIEKVLSSYASRYTTKANKTIYELMVIALRAELQNILYNLKYEKLDVALGQVQLTASKYLAIATSGNQSIAGTMAKFIGEIEYLFNNAVKIEYNYYVKKEQAKQEQLAIREQMRQEAEERKALELEKKKIEAEELKYLNEIDKVKLQMQEASEEEQESYKRRILELEALLSDVAVKKADIVKLQNGKAGNIYVISNLGSFGENVFKIGMTRRIEPQDRVDELGSASVPFRFDVHSFIFSENAVELENQLHKRLNDQRVNKVNLRKEFFYSTVDKLENLVTEIEPTAEFNKTMLAEDFRQSQSSDVVYTSDYTEDDTDIDMED